MAPGISVIVPVFNEADSVPGTVASVRSVMQTTDLDFEIIVVDDGCTDDSCKDLPVTIGADSRVSLLRHEHNRGYGAALKTRIENARFDTVLIIDADKTYPPERIPDLLAHVAQYDMVVGERTGPAAYIPWIRKPAKAILRWLAETLSGKRIPDINSGLRLFSRDQGLKAMDLLPDGFSFTTTLTLLWLHQRRSIRYVPIEYTRRAGKSKIRPFRDTVNFFILVVRTTLWFNPMKVFLPAGLIVMGLGLVLYFFRVFSGPAFLVTTVVTFTTGIQLIIFGALADLIVKRLR